MSKRKTPAKKKWWTAILLYPECVAAFWGEAYCTSFEATTWKRALEMARNEMSTGMDHVCGSDAFCVAVIEGKHTCYGGGQND